MKQIVLVTLTLLLLTTCGKQGRKGVYSEVDSLLTVAYNLRYTHADSTEALARKALLLASDNSEDKARAYNMLAFVCYHDMDYDRALVLCDSSYNLSHNQIVLLCSDVMKMKVTQRIGDGRRFYEARSSASRRLRRIEEEVEILQGLDRHDYYYAQAEYHIISSTYYYYQDQDSLAKAEMATIDQLEVQKNDSTQWLNYLYMMGSGGLVDGSYEEVAKQEFEYLINCFANSLRINNSYFAGNALQALASRLKTKYDRDIIRERFFDSYNMLYGQHIFWMPRDSIFTDDYFPQALARHALSLFQDYGDLFQTACVYRTLGELSFYRGFNEASLDYYKHALSCVNEHHKKYYPHSKDTLQAYNANESGVMSIERRWIEDESVQTVPEWMAGIRQQLTMTYSALDMKSASDYNRNIYLDILESTSQNREIESRKKELEEEIDIQHTLLWAAASVLLLFLFLFIYLLLRLRPHLSNEESASLNSSKRILKDDQVRVEALLDRLEELHEEYEVSRLRISQNKIRNVEKRAKVSLVQAVTPFLDRILNEISRMKKRQQCEPQQLEYIAELSDQIVSYNDILTEWIQMERGQLSLQISTIELQELFEIVERGHYAFDQQGVKLIVEPTDFQVKADKALTLFMLNTLADNARKFTPSGGSVRVSATEGEGYVELSVSDTGCGLKPEDIDTIVNSKVYDAGQIGANDADVHGKKGFGFGLMNCKGIIEKYKKASKQFYVCTFGIESKVGEGSRFFFRLPRVMMLVLSCLLSTNLFAGNDSIPSQTVVDADLATHYYDLVYDCNVEGYYEDAIFYADSALMAYNPELKLFPSDNNANEQEALEVNAYRNGEDWDYILLMNLRNEIAVAALALHEWDLYNYNNRLCVYLHKLYHQDKTLPTYCDNLQNTKSKSQQITVLLVILSLISVVLIYMLFKGRRRLAADITRSIQHDISQQEDLLSHSKYEESRLHVQNQVLDNCLSTIKHESMYYPSRIRQLVDTEDVDLQQLDELTIYYKQMYTLLSGQAERQTANVGQRREQIELSAVKAIIKDAFSQATKKSKSSTKLLVDGNNNNESSCYVRADSTLLSELFKQLFTYVLTAFPQTEEITLQTDRQKSVIRFIVASHEITYSDQESHNLFYPSKERIPLLIVKQIIRDTDALNNNPGLRLVADEHSIWFTLPVSDTKK